MEGRRGIVWEDETLSLPLGNVAFLIMFFVVDSARCACGRGTLTTDEDDDFRDIALLGRDCAGVPFAETDGESTVCGVKSGLPFWATELLPLVVGACRGTVGSSASIILMSSFIMSSVNNGRLRTELMSPSVYRFRDRESFTSPRQNSP